MNLALLPLVVAMGNSSSRAEKVDVEDPATDEAFQMTVDPALLVQPPPQQQPQQQPQQLPQAADGAGACAPLSPPCLLLCKCAACALF